MTQEAVVKKKNIYGIMMLVNLLFFAAMHAFFVGFTNDDSYFVILRGEYDSLPELLKFRYQTDSSRILSEAILFTLIQCPFVVWQILDVLICVLVYGCLCRLLVNDPYSTGNIWVFLGFASYPFMHMGSAGWICTSLNYLWPFATLLYALVVVQKRNNGEKVTIAGYIAAIAAMIFTANCEMPAAALFMLFLAAGIYAIIEKRSKWYEILGACIGLAGVIFALSAPGNEERTAMEAANWMPEFFDLGFWDKARLCSVFVFEHFVAIPDAIFFLFALVLTLAGTAKTQKWYQKIIAVCPLAIDLLFTGFYFVKDFILGHKTSYDYTYPAIYMTELPVKVLQLSEVAGLLLFIAASIYTIWQILPLKKAIWCIWTLATGFAVRMALMLSPTMFSSWHRTLIFMYFAFLYTAIIIIFKCGLLDKKWCRRLLGLVFAAGIIINLILTIGLQIRKAGGYY